MRASRDGLEALARGASVALLLFGSACSDRPIVAVDPCSSDALDGLVGYWRLNEAVDSTMARDWSGQDNTGTLLGLDPAAAWTTGGPEGGALSAQGKGYVKVPRSESIDRVVDQVTVAAWMFLQGTPVDYATAISRQVGTTFGQTYHLSVNAQMLPWLFITTPASGQVVVRGVDAVPMQTWVHLVGTYDGAQARLYVDGQPIANGPVTGAFAPETNPVVLSGNANNVDQAIVEVIPGRVDGVLLYQRALSAGQIARLHACGSLVSAGTFR